MSIRALLEAFPSKSVGRKPYKSIRVPGHGLLSTEPHDGDDTFPPAIASYEVADGRLIYHGKDGSTGVIVGTRAQLRKWMADVDSAIPVVDDDHAWTRQDGGAALVKAAVKMARATLRKKGERAKIEVRVKSGGMVASHASGNSIVLYNVHKTHRVDMLGISVPWHLKNAAHEAAHILFRHGGRPVIAALKAYRAQGGDYLSMYHALSPQKDFEGAMEAAALYMLKPAHLRKKAPGVYVAVLAWLG